MASSDDKTKVPSWDGTPESSEVYKTKARWYVKGFKAWEQDIAVSKLVVKLTGRAWDAIQQLPEERWTFLRFCCSCSKVVWNQQFQKVAESFASISPNSDVRKVKP